MGQRAKVIARHCVVLLTLCAVAESHAQDLFTLDRIEGPVTIDGVLDDSVWETLAPLPLVMYEPVFRGEMTEQTEIRVGHDDDYIYASARFYYHDAGDMRANSMYRDRYSGDDTFSLLLDTFNDQQHSLWFATNPNGVRFDYSISNDLEYGFGDPFQRVINRSWNTFWDAATTRTEDGWFAEMRIPFSSLGFQDQGGTVEMGLAVSRWMPAKAEIHVFPAIPPSWNMGWAKPSQYARVRLEGAVSKRPLYITPYAAGGASRTNALDDAQTSYVQSDAFQGDIGLDAKYSVTNNLTLDVSVNTDFAQVEADDAQVSLDRVPLFFPEKRQFFQERAGVFEFRTMGRNGRIFHSRRIGLHEGRAVPILGGVRMVGRVGRWDVGMLNMQTAALDDLPRENFGVYRVRRDVFNANSFVGAILTTRLGWDGTYNHVYGFDSQFRTAPNDYLIVKWAQVLSNDTSLNPLEDFSGGFARVRLERRQQIGLSFTLSGSWQGQHFAPGIGFLSRAGFVNPFFVVGYGWLAGESSRVLSYQGRVLTTQYIRDHDGSLDWALFRFDFPIIFKNGDEHTGEVEVNIDDFLEPLELPAGVLVPAGRYTHTAVGWSYAMSDGRLLRADATVTAGSLYDGTNLGLELEPTWNVSRNLELGAAYQFNRVRFPKRDEGFSVHIARLRMQIGFTTKMSVNAFLQYNALTDDFLTNVRFRYNFREGNDLWLVFNEGRNTDPTRSDPVLPNVESRTLLLKYTYTFIR